MIAGKETYLGADLIEAYGAEVIIGNFSSIADEVEFLGVAHHQNIRYRKCVTTYAFNNRLKLPTFYESAVSRNSDLTIRIGNDVWVGEKSLIMDGITIGDGAIIGTRAVITKDVPPYAVVVGNPSVIKKYRFTPEQIESLLKIKWWDWDREIIRERVEDFKDIDVFIKKYGNTTV